MILFPPIESMPSDIQHRINNMSIWPSNEDKPRERNKMNAFPPNEDKPQGRNNMNSLFNSNKILDKMFRKADGVVWDLMTGNIGIQTDEGIVTLSGEGADAVITQNLFDDFGVVLPAFAQSIPVADVKVGDIIYRNSRNNVAWIIEKNEDKKTFKLMKPNGETSGWTPPKVQMLGFDTGVMVLRSLISMLPNGSADMGSMQSMLMPMMLFGNDSFGGDGVMDKMMPLMLMQMMNGNGNTGMNNMMPFLMMQMMSKNT